MPEPQPADGYCRRQPTSGSYLGDKCDDCGHALVAHAGVEHCPVCEMVDLNRQARAALDHGEIRIDLAGASERTVVDAVRRVLEQDRLRNRFRSYLR